MTDPSATDPTASAPTASDSPGSGTPDLTGQVALVTGGNGGIGLGMAEGLVLAGASVMICGRNQDKLDVAAAQLSAVSDGARVAAVRADVAVESDVIAAVAATVERFGRLDSCVANAGISGDAAILDLSLDEWRRVMSVNLDGVFLTLREAARQMVAQGDGGALVAVSSTSSEHGAPRQAHYATSKAGILALVRSMAVALARHGIRANSLVPGWTLTELTELGYGYDKFREATIARTPVRRWGQPEDFRSVAVFLCDRRNSFHTGDEVTLDGGYTVF
jgi:NAD(P)-dependent dehydrogenase (short-subunit alcohol dehydrogenase family)